MNTSDNWKEETKVLAWEIYGGEWTKTDCENKLITYIESLLLSQKQELASAVSLLKQARKYLNPSGEITSMNAIYVTPAQALRDSANAIDRKDALIAKIDALLTPLEK